MAIVYGMSGWWSGFSKRLRQPIEMPLALVRERAPHIQTMTGTWHERKIFAQHAKDHPQASVWVGHSYGASGATHAFPQLKQAVRLFISLDQGLDSWVIVDKPVTMNVLEVDEWHVAYERLSYVDGYPSSRINFMEHEQGPGSWLKHTSFFTQEAIVNRIANRIIEVLS